MKHVELDCHFIREQIQAGQIVTKHVNTNSQLANIFTKALGRNEFDTFRDKLDILDLYAPT